jgi:hypothetical protein
MTTDFENELRDLFREKAGEAPLATPAMPASAPPQVLRRGRLHQVGTVLGSAVVVVALIVGSVAGLTWILGEGQDDRVGSGYEVFQRTATIEAFTVGSPSDWFLVNEWPMSMLIAVQGSAGTGSACTPVPGDPNRECANPPGVETTSPIPVPHGLPMLQLSNVDLGLSANACADGVPGDAAVLYVALDYDAAIAGIADPSIPDLQTGAGLPPQGDGPCGPGRYAYFTVNGERFFSWIGVGSDASDEDREAVETSYERMSAIPGWTPTPPNETTPAYVIAGGDYGPGDDWRIELRPDGSAIQLSLEGSPAPDVLLTDGSVAPLTWTGTDPMFGVVTKAATGVEFRPGTGNVDLALGRSPVSGRLVPIPPTLGAFGFDLFFIDPPQGYGDLRGRVIALGIEDETSSSPSPDPSEERTAVVELGGTYLGHTWLARFRGDFEDTACLAVSIDGGEDPTGPSCRHRPTTSWSGPTPSVDSFIFFELHVGAGSVPSEIIDLRFRSDDRSRAEVEGTCVVGPIGWTDHNVCAIVLPPEDSGTFEYRDEDGTVIFNDAASWGPAGESEAVPTPAEPVHGGSYWAVYVWAGEARSPEANAAVAALSEDFGIQAFQGDLGCDDGAAEALPPGATWGVAVYFATGADATAFADEYRSRNPGSDPVMAHVTTYCLD